jgi:acetoacetyl-CoA synthetase
MSSGKEGKFHRQTNSRDTALQYTTTGWIMYLTSVMSLQFGACAVLYNGSPFLPNPTRFIKLLSELKVTAFGTSPRWMQEMVKHGIKPREIADLSTLRIVSSTGMVLSDQLFEWFYDVGFPKHVQLANISGGTDIAACFGMENPLTPVYVGGCQGPSLGTPIAVYDSLIEGGKGVKGAAVDFGTPGELVATAAFPNMPVFFWGDDGSKYFSAYFEKYDNVWTHGDFVMTHPITKGLIFLGHADGVLNPSGVRFGSAEIYSVLESHFAQQLADSICVGQRRPQDTDESVMLFLLMKPGEKFTPKLVNDIKTAIRKELSARHVPKYVFETPDIPVSLISFYFILLTLIFLHLCSLYVLSCASNL